MMTAIKDVASQITLGRRRLELLRRRRRRISARANIVLGVVVVVVLSRATTSRFFYKPCRRQLRRGHGGGGLMKTGNNKVFGPDAFYDAFCGYFLTADFASPRERGPGFVSDSPFPRRRSTLLIVIGRRTTVFSPRRFRNNDGLNDIFSFPPPDEIDRFHVLFI